MYMYQNSPDLDMFTIQVYNAITVPAVSTLFNNCRSNMMWRQVSEECKTVEMKNEILKGVIHSISTSTYCTKGRQMKETP